MVSCLRGKVPRPKMVSSNQKRFQLCFVRNSPRGRASRASSTQNENPARVRVRGRGLGNPYLVVYEGLLLRGLRFANSRTRPNLPHGTSCCGIFATLGEYFCPITLLGDFPVRMSQIRTRRGACSMGVETILLIVILAFAAGFVLDRLAIRRGRFDAAKSKKEQ